MKAQIFDLIAAAGCVGVSSHSIIGSLYFDRRPVIASTIKSHVDQINDLLAETDVRIISNRRRWFIYRKIAL